MIYSKYRCEKKIKIIVSAYACNPDEGSEKGAGWNWIISLSQIFENVIVLTRGSSKSAIERQDYDRNKIKFVYIENSNFIIKIKKYFRINRLYYVLWQIKIRRISKKIAKNEKPDYVHHLTWATFILPIGIYSKGFRLVIGPIGGAVLYPWRIRKILNLYNRKEIIGELLRLIWQKLLIPITRLNSTFRRAEIILVQNEQTAKVFKWHLNVRVLSNAGAKIDLNCISQGEKKGLVDVKRIVFLGRLVHVKGLELAIMAMTDKRLVEFKLDVIGSGPLENKYRKMVSNLELENRIRFLGRTSHKQIYDHMRKANVFVLPSLREEGAPFTAVEAMSIGLPIVALNNGGPITTLGKGSGVLVSIEPVETLVQRFATGILDATKIESEIIYKNFRDFDWDTLFLRIKNIYT